MKSTLKRNLPVIGGLLLIPWGAAQAQTTIRMEAEDMTLDTYNVEVLDFASSGALINLKGYGYVGSATAPFPGEDGAYDITVVYHDENDGLAQLSVSIDGTEVDSWTLDFKSTESQPQPANRLTREIATGYSVSNGDEIRIDGLQGNWDHANVDYIEFVSVGNPPMVLDFSKGEITIEEPGYYVLDRDWRIELDGLEAVLEVAADDVTIDMRGFEIELAANDAIQIRSERATLKNGTLTRVQLSVSGADSYLTGLRMNIFAGQTAISLLGDHGRIENSTIDSRIDGALNESQPIYINASHTTVQNNRIRATGDAISTRGNDVYFTSVLGNVLECDGSDCLLIYGDHNVIARNTARQYSRNSFANIIGESNHFIDNVSTHYDSFGITAILVEGTRNILRGNIIQSAPFVYNRPLEVNSPFKFGIHFSSLGGGNYYSDNLISADELVNSSTGQIDLGGNHGL